MNFLPMKVDQLAFDLFTFVFWATELSPFLVLPGMEWNHIVFNDESRLCLGMHYGYALVKRERGENVILALLWRGMLTTLWV